MARRQTRRTISLACQVCQSRNYKTTKAPTDGASPLTLKKFCKLCKQHTTHRENK